MKAEVLATTELAILGEFAVVLFVGIFVGSLVWIFRPGAKESYEQRSRLPLGSGAQGGDIEHG